MKYKLFKQPSKTQLLLKKLQTLEVNIITTYNKLSKALLIDNQSIEKKTKIQNLIEISNLQLKKVRNHIQMQSK